MTHKKRTQVDSSKELEKITVTPGNVGDTASGQIYLQYGNTIVFVPYDTKGGPDGLFTCVDKSLGDWTHGQNKEKYIDVLVTEKVLSDAKNHFSGDIRHKAVRGKITVKEL